MHCFTNRPGCIEGERKEVGAVTEVVNADTSLVDRSTWIPMVRRATAIMEELYVQREMRRTAIVREVGVPENTIFRLIRHLRFWGLVEMACAERGKQSYHLTERGNRAVEVCFAQDEAAMHAFIKSAAPMLGEAHVTWNAYYWLDKRAGAT